LCLWWASITSRSVSSSTAAAARLNQAQHEIDAGAEVRRLADRNPPCCLVDDLLLRRIQPGGTQNPGNITGDAGLGMLRHGGGGREIDEDIRAREPVQVAPVNSGRYGRDDGRVGIVAQQHAVQPEHFGILHELGQHTAHAAAAAGNGHPRGHGFMSSKKRFTPSNQLRWRGLWPWPPS
jgi:hypothetical protein